MTEIFSTQELFIDSKEQRQAPPQDLLESNLRDRDFGRSNRLLRRVGPILLTTPC